MDKKIKTTKEVFKQVLIDLGFHDCKPSEMTNSDYWLCTSVAMETYLEIHQKKECYKKCENTEPFKGICLNCGSSIKEIK